MVSLIDPSLRASMLRSGAGQGLLSLGAGLMAHGTGGGSQALQRGIEGIGQAMDPMRIYQAQMIQNQLQEQADERSRWQAWDEAVSMLGQGEQPMLGGSLVDMPGGGTEPGQAQTAMLGPIEMPPEMIAGGGIPPQLLQALGPERGAAFLAQMYKPPAAEKPTTLMQNLEAAGFKPGTPEYQARAAAAIPGAADAQREKAQDAAGFWRWTDTGERVFPDVTKPDEQPKQGDVAGMRKEFSGQSKDYRAVRTSFSKVQETAKSPSAAGDLALIFNYMKMLDPGSVVREGEFATAQSAAGVPTQVRNVYNRLVSGERLAPEQRQDFLNQAYNVYSAQASGQNLLEEQYRDLAERSGYDPENVVIDYQGKLREMTPLGQVTTEVEAGGTEAPAQVSNQSEYDALPSGAQYVAPDGKTRIKR